MKKALFMAGMLLLLLPFMSQSQTVSTPLQIQTASVLDIIADNSMPVPTMSAVNGVFRVSVRWCDETLADDCVYARRFYENDYYDGVTLTDDVVVRFYSDASGTVPTNVSGLTVYYRVIGFNGTSGYDFTSSAVAYGDNVVLASGNEHDYNDGTTQRYRDYHLEDGYGYIPQ